MADLTWSEVVDLDAALTAVDAQAQTMILAHVNESVDPAVFGGVTSGTFLLARAALAAHLGRGALEAGTGTSGQVASKTVGGLSKSYFQAAAADTTGMGETRWGRTWLSLCRNSAARAGLLV